MRAFVSRSLVGLALWLTVLTPTLAQVTPPTPVTPADTVTHQYENPNGIPTPPAVRPPWYKGKLVRASIIPAILITYGATTINGNGLYSSYQANRDIHKLFPTFRTRADDILLVAPYLELGAVLLAGVESRDDNLNIGLVILKSEAIMLSSVFALKNLTKIRRPDNSDMLSFPSGHTAQAFLAASIVHNEFRHKSQWYGIGAYTIATSVAALRMINSKHWQSDVVAGAGIGILSAHVGYLTHRNRWGRKPILPKGMSFSPTWQYNAPGVGMVWQL